MTISYTNTRYYITAILLTIASLASATTITVDSTDATMGMTSLRTAVANAMSGDTIVFDASIDGDTIFLTTEIRLDKNLVIIGNPSTSSGQAHNTIIDGMGTSRIFHITAGDTVSISGIKMQGGNGGGSTSPGSGGAILNQGTLTFTNSTISGNTATFGGGVFNTGTSTFTNTAISGNTANLGGAWTTSPAQRPSSIQP